MQIISLIRRNRYELIAFLTGASVMILEIVGARLIAPYFGTSTYVWTSMIGVILGALSFGMWYGGKLADRYDTKNDLSLIIAGSAALVLATTLFYEPVLNEIASQRLDLRLSSIIAALVLFGPPSLLIGMVSPHLAKIRVTSLKKTGTTIGRLEAAGSVGSIGGTFISGYWLLAFFGARSVTLCLVVILILTSFLANRRQLIWSRLLVAAIAVMLLNFQTLPSGIVNDIDSAYSRYRVAQKTEDGRKVNYLLMDNQSIQSAVFVDNPEELVFDYTKSMAQAVISFPDADEVLMIGGGTHTLPTALSAKHPEIHFDIVEIDPALDDIARQHFGFKEMDNIDVRYEDGRSYLNKRQGNYDVILMDAFTSLTPPFHLTSKETVALIQDNLKPDGLAVVNIPTHYYGDFLPSISKTYNSVFSHIALIKTDPDLSLGKRQNFLVIASDSRESFDAVTEKLDNQIDTPEGGEVLTDDYAPVERLSY